MYNDCLLTSVVSKLQHGVTVQMN